LSASNLNHDEIFKVVESFYDKAKTDVMIGYHFRHIEDFDEHIPRIVSFWEIQLLGQSQEPLSEPFDLIGKHKPLKFRIGEVNRWVMLFNQTLDEYERSHPLQSAFIEEWRHKVAFFQQRFLSHPAFFN
jgi:truncated hemoglobin YjbI